MIGQLNIESVAELVSAPQYQGGARSTTVGPACEQSGLPAVGDAHYRRPVECRAMRVERRPVHRLIACAAGPCGVAAVAKACDLADEDPGVSVPAAHPQPPHPRAAVADLATPTT